jgi:hypothetical protein
MFGQGLNGAAQIKAQAFLLHRAALPGFRFATSKLYLA